MIDPWAIALLSLLAFGSATVGAISGFGAGLIVTLFLVPLFGVKASVPIVTVAMAFSNLSRVWVNRSEIEPHFLVPLLVTTLPGVMLGTLIYDALPPRALALVIGAFMIVSVALRHLFKRYRPQPTARGALVVGFGFGVLSGSSPGAGIIMIAILLALGLSGPALIATDAVIGLLINVVKAVMFGTLDLLDLETAGIGVIIGLAMVPGAYAARWLTEKMGARLHVAFIEVVVIAGGGYFIFQAFSQ